MSSRFVALLLSLAALVTSAPAVTTMTGTWNNTTFTSMGGLTVQLDVSLPNISVTLDLDGNVFGGSDPSPLVLDGSVDILGNGSFNSNTAHPAGHPTYGMVTGSVSSGSVVHIDMPNVPNPGILSATIDGTLSPAGPGATNFDGTYVVNFTQLGQQGFEGQDYALGTLTAAVPEPTAAALAALSAALLIRRRRA